MYSVERTADKIIVRRGSPGKVIFMSATDSLIVYNEPEPTVSKVGDLNDEQLLLALVNIVEIKNFQDSTRPGE